LIELFRLFQNNDSQLDPYRGLPNNDRTRGNTKRLAMSYSRTNIKRHSFFVRIVRDWNSLPQVLVDAPSINRVGQIVGK
jgi:hypothetical protein